jgi:hypothetical protein
LRHRQGKFCVLGLAHHFLGLFAGRHGLGALVDFLSEASDAVCFTLLRNMGKNYSNYSALPLVASK